MGIKRRGGSVAPSRSAAPAPRPATHHAPAPTHAPTHAPAAPMSSNAMQKHQPTSPATTQSHAPAPAHQPHAPAPAPHAPQQQPMMQPQQSSGGGFLSNVAGGIMNGMTFGVGSAVANRAVDAIMGPRTMQVEHVNQSAPDAAPAAAPAAAPMAAAPAMMQQPTAMNQDTTAAGRCTMELDYFNRCMQLNNNSFDACTQYSTALQQCQRQ